jgi:hypothetical protein
VSSLDFESAFDSYEVRGEGAMVGAGAARGGGRTSAAALLAAALLCGCNGNGRLIRDVQDELRRQLPSTYEQVEFLNMQVSGSHVCGEYRIPRAGGGYSVGPVAFWGIRSGGRVTVHQVWRSTAAELCSDRTT